MWLFRLKFIEVIHLVPGLKPSKLFFLPSKERWHQPRQRVLKNIPWERAYMTTHPGESLHVSTFCQSSFSHVLHDCGSFFRIGSSVATLFWTLFGMTDVDVTEIDITQQNISFKERKSLLQLYRVIT